jgi:acetolactate synthase I/II/III large subunit
MKTCTALAKALTMCGIDVMFGVIGDGNLFIVHGYVNEAGGRYVAASNEAGAVLMANGYASTSGQVGAATITHGPALTNTMTALVDGVRSRTSILVVAGDTPISRKNHRQNIAQREVVSAAGAGFEQVRSTATIGSDVVTAFRRTILERRPVVLNVPAELQLEETVEELSGLDPVLLHGMTPEPDPDSLDRFVGIVATAARPIILAGRGAAHPESRMALLRLAERLGAPVATTLLALDLFHGSPFNLGIFGTLSTDIATEVIAQSDCVVVFGASLDPKTTDSGALLRGKRVVQCDIDNAQIGRYQRVDAGVIGDVKVIADTVGAWLDKAEVEPASFRSDALASRLRGYSPWDFKDRGTAVSVDIRTALLKVEEAVPKCRTLVTDGGAFFNEAMRILHVEEPHAYVQTVSFGSIGLGMGNAIGASFGAPGRPTLLVCGDGGFMLGGLTEFNTAVRHSVDLIVVILNDGAYGAEYVQFNDQSMSPDLSLFEWPEFAQVAAALGGHGVTVRNTGDLEQMCHAIRHRDRPLVIDVKLDPAEIPRH